jgi:hypothetical protein
MARNDAKREHYLETLKEVCHSPEMLLFLDETSRSKNAAHHRRFWSKQSQTPFRKMAYYGPGFDPCFTMIAAYDIDGFILDACDVIERKRGKSDSDETHGTINKC